MPEFYMPFARKIDKIREFFVIIARMVFWVFEVLCSFSTPVSHTRC